MDLCEHTSLVNYRIVSITYGHVCMYMHMHTHHSYHFVSPQGLQTLRLYYALAREEPGSSQRRNNTKNNSSCKMREVIYKY